MITDSLYILCETCINILQESENSLHVQEFKIKAIHQLYSLGGSETVVASVNRDIVCVSWTRMADTLDTLFH